MPSYFSLLTSVDYLYIHTHIFTYTQFINMHVHICTYIHKYMLIYIASFLIFQCSTLISWMEFEVDVVTWRKWQLKSDWERRDKVKNTEAVLQDFSDGSSGNGLDLSWKQSLKSCSTPALTMHPLTDGYRFNQGLGCVKGDPQLYRKSTYMEHFLSQGC